MMKRLILMLAAAVPASVIAQTLPVYENRGTVSSPQIDARAILNSGTFNVSVTQPFETLNTVNYTNLPSGLMQGGVGFRFDYSTLSNRQAAANFVNQGNISVNNSSFNFSSAGISLGGASDVLLPGSFLLISATNVANSGTMSASPEGLLQIKGQNVSVARGGLRTGEVPGVPSASQRGTVLGDGYYMNAGGVTDLYAGVGTNGTFSGQGPAFNVSRLQMPLPSSGTHEVLQNLFTNRVSVGSPLNSYGAWAMTNRVTPSNYTVQAVFVATNNADPNFAVKVKFGRSTDPSALTDARMPIVEMSMWDIDAVTGLPFTNYVYVLDSTAVITNLIYLTNFVNTNVFRPSTIEIARGTPAEWRSANDGNTLYTNSLLVSTNYAGNTVTNTYAGHSVQIGSAASTASGFSGGFYFGFLQDFSFLSSPLLNDPTNLPGRIEIDAENIDMTLFRARSEGLLTIKAKNVTGGAPTRIDAPTVVFDLGSTNQLLSVAGVVPDAIRRLDGQLTIFSTVFTNQILSVSNTNTADPTDPAGFVTNVIDVKTHALVVDPFFNTLRAVAIRDFAMKATNVFIGDKLTISGNLTIDAETLTTSTNARVVLTADPNLDATNVPRLRSWTNNGVVSAGNSVDLIQTAAGGGPLLTNFINKGSISSSTLSIWSDTLETSGQITSGRGPIQLKAQSLKISGGRVTGSGDISLESPDIKIRGATLQAGGLQGINYNLGAINLVGATRLSDGGADAKNSLTTYFGFNLLSKPVEGDLFGTKVKSVGPRYTEVSHVWEGEDRGSGPAGFSNNVVVGHLVLDGDLNSLFSFRGSGISNALYVDYLELTNSATNFNQTIKLADNFKIYFAAANLPVEQLDGALGGKLQWARSFAGPNSSTNITLASGQVVSINKSVFTSATIDSDGDGIPNRTDSSPFDGVKITGSGISTEGGLSAFIRWSAAPQLEYTVEFNSDLGTTNWLFLGSVINTQRTNVVVQVSDKVPAGEPQRYYRVRYNP